MLLGTPRMHCWCQAVKKVLDLNSKNPVWIQTCLFGFQEAFLEPKNEFWGPKKQGPGPRTSGQGPVGDQWSGTKGGPVDGTSGPGPVDRAHGGTSGRAREKWTRALGPLGPRAL